MVWVSVEEYGVWLGKRYNRIVVRKGGEVVKEISADKVDGISIGTNVGLTSSLIAHLAEKCIPIIVETYNTHYFFPSYALAFPELRIKQSRLSDERKNIFVHSVLLSKVLNQKANLECWGFDVELVVKRDALEMEREFAKKYWKMVKMLIPLFEKRDKFGEDPFNSSLNYLYGILKHRILNAVLSVGLDPYFGIFHAVKQYRLSFVFDVMEIFRPVCDFVAVDFFRHNHVNSFDEIKYRIAKQFVKMLDKRFRWKDKRERLTTIFV
jgi:CRISPR-associated protein Cas1